MENPTKIDDLGVPIIFGNTHIWNDQDLLGTQCWNPMLDLELQIQRTLPCKLTQLVLEIAIPCQNTGLKHDMKNKHVKRINDEKSYHAE